MSIFDWFHRRQDNQIVHALDVIGELKRHEHVPDMRHTSQSPYGDSLELYRSTERLIAAANYPDSTDFALSVIDTFADARRARRAPIPHDNILERMAGIAAGLYSAEQLSHLPPLEALAAPGVIGYARDFLLSQQLKATDAEKTVRLISDRLIEAFESLTRRLPALALEGQERDGVPTLSIIDLISDAPLVIEEISAVFLQRNEHNVLRKVAETIEENAQKASDLLKLKRVIGPRDHPGSSREIAEAYLADTGFSRLLLQVEIPFDISIEDRGEHCAIIAGSGWGKTQLLQTIIASDLRLYDPPGMVIIDSTGAMPQRIQRLAVFNERLKGRLIIIDPESDPVPALNMFDMSNPRMAEYSTNMREAIEGEVIALFNYVFSSIQNPLTTRMQTAFTFMVRLLLSIPGANMRTLLELLDDDPAKGIYEQAAFKPHIDKLDETTQHFFKVQYYTGKESGLREQIRARVFDIIKVPAFERMFAGVNRIDFFAELNRGSIIVINTSENLLKEGSPTFGRYMIARVMAAAFERATIKPERRRQAFLIVDEAAPYFDETFEKLLTRVRQFKLGVCIAFQHLDQASEKLRSAIASSTAVKYGGGTGYADARWLGHEMRVDPEFIQAQKRDSKRPPQWSQFACYVRNYTDRAVSLTVPFYALERMPQMTDAEHAALLVRNRARVSAPAVAQSVSAPLPPSQLPEQTTASAAPEPEVTAQTTAHMADTLNVERPRDTPGPAVASRDGSATTVSGSPATEQKAPPASQYARANRGPDPPSEGATDWD